MSDYGMQAQTEMWDAIASQPARYVVKCDECKTEIRRTDSVHESACGGYCDTCRAALDARYPERVANRERSTRRDRLEARADRLEGWAAQREQRASAVLASHDRYRGDHAFNFQPGHIPERARVIKQADRAFESLNKAKDMASRADGIRSQLATAIYSDDTDAAEQLAAKIARLEAERDRVKAYNASCRKGQRDTGLLDERQQADLASTAKACPYQIGKHGEMPSYVLTNLGGNITRNKKRLAQIQAQAAAVETGQRGAGRRMSSRYSGTCPDCGDTFDRGDEIVWYRFTREAVCARCVS